MTQVHPDLGGCQRIPTASLRTLGLGAHGRKGLGAQRGTLGPAGWPPHVPTLPGSWCPLCQMERLPPPAGIPQTLAWGRALGVGIPLGPLCFPSS